MPSKDYTPETRAYLKRNKTTVYALSKRIGMADQSMDQKLSTGYSLREPTLSERRMYGSDQSNLVVVMVKESLDGRYFRVWYCREDLDAKRRRESRTRYR